jgi:hypothetical protein
MRELEPIGMALYKRLFRHFSNLYQSASTPEALRFEKDYEAILAEWLGGLKPERYASRVEQQLGAHLDGLAATGLIRRWQIAKKADGTGLKITFYPGKGFFRDYDQFYRSPLSPPVRAARDRNFRAVQHRTNSSRTSMSAAATLPACSMPRKSPSPPSFSTATPMTTFATSSTSR